MSTLSLHLIHTTVTQARSPLCFFVTGPAGAVIAGAIRVFLEVDAGEAARFFELPVLPWN
jgi:hypothetical protein